MITQLVPRSFTANEGPANWFLNLLCTVKAATESTGSAFSLTHILSPPGHSTPLHLHHHEDEVFWVLDGEHGFYCEGKTTVLGPGGYMFLPRGIPHGNRVVGDRPATMLVLAMPGTGFVGMMQEVGQPAKARVLPQPAAPDVERLTGIAEKYGIEILGPLPE